MLKDSPEKYRETVRTLAKSYTPYKNGKPQ